MQGDNLRIPDPEEGYRTWRWSLHRGKTPLDQMDNRRLRNLLEKVIPERRVSIRQYLRDLRDYEDKIKRILDKRIREDKSWVRNKRQQKPIFPSRLPLATGIESLQKPMEEE